MRALNRKLVRDLWALRAQGLAIALVVAAGVTTFVTFFGTLDSVRLTQRDFYDGYRFADVFASLTRAPEPIADRLREIPGVRDLETRVVSGANLEVEGFLDPITSQVISLPNRGQPLLNRLHLSAGALPGPDRPGEVAVSEAFAEAHGLQPGDTLRAVLYGRLLELTITGIATSPEHVYQISPGELFPDFERYAILWMRRGPLETAVDMEGAFNDVTATLYPGTATPLVLEAMDAVLARYGGRGAYDREDQLSHRYLEEELEQLEGMAGFIPMLFLGVAAFLLHVVVGRVIRTQREQIAVLKAFGYGHAAIGLHYAALVLSITAVGALIGVAAGSWLAAAFAELYAQFFRFPFLRLHLEPRVALLASAVALGAALLGALGALRAAVSLPPAEGMRPEPPPRYRPTVIERLGLQRLFDQPTRMILRHLERQPGKAALSVLGIALATGILVVGNYRDAVDHLAFVSFDLLQRQDLTVTFIEPTSERVVHELRARPGVQAAEPFRAVAVDLVNEHRSHRGAIQGIEPDARLQQLLDDRLRPVPLPADGLLLTDHLGAMLGVGPGDTLTVEVLEGRRRTVEVPVAGLVSEFIGLNAYMDRSALHRALREAPQASGAHLAVDAAALPALFAELRRTPRVAGAVQRDAFYDTFYETMAQMLLVMMVLITVLASIIAFGVVYNAARIAFAERSRELATLRVLGFRRAEVAYILVGEIVVLTLLALPLGFVLGRLFLRLLVGTVSAEVVRIPLIVEPHAYAFAATVVLAATAVSCVLLVRQVNRLDIVSALKVEE